MRIETVVNNLRQGSLQRILAFGSSNTERMLSGMHWFDCLELAMKQTLGRAHRCINVGIGGNTTRDLLERFEQDGLFYRPHLVLITAGGNDCNPERDVSLDEFRSNLLDLQRRFAQIGCGVVFQTYYAPDWINCDARGQFFCAYMQVVREVARETGSELIDHLPRWMALQEEHPQIYRPLMQDALHLNRHGNLVFGLDLVRRFGLEVGSDCPEFWSEARRCQELMDAAASRRNEPSAELCRAAKNTARGPAA